MGASKGEAQLLASKVAEVPGGRWVMPLVFAGWTSGEIREGGERGCSASRW
jgi:hypothetical protein